MLKIAKPMFAPPVAKSKSSARRHRADGSRPSGILRRHDALTIGAVGDPLEREADRIADAVLRAPPTRSVGVRSVGPGSGLADAPASVHDVLRSPGEPLDAATRAYFEPRFGHDFSRVRVHAGASAEQSARDVSANAYTVGQNVVFGRGRLAPGTAEGKRLLAHELVHVAQQTSESSPMLQRQVDEEPENPWNKLSPPIRKEVQELYDECDNAIEELLNSQLIHQSLTRSAWLSSLREIRSRIEALDSDSKLPGVRNAYDNSIMMIDFEVNKSSLEWSALNDKYVDIRRWLLSKQVQSTDSIEAARYLESIYRDIPAHIPPRVADDDYAELKNALDKQEYIRVGALRGARVRAKSFEQLMREAANLRRNGEDANNFLPAWSDRVLEEAAYLDTFAKLARENGREYALELADWRKKLLEQRQETLKVKPDESVLEKGADFVAGAAENIAGMFFEAAKEAVDLAQINLHIITFGKYEPEFISDMAEAARQGATTGELLTGMVTGLLDTPSRFLKACRDGDWKAIGSESVNLYSLAKTIRAAPGTIKKVPGAVKKLPDLLARTQESLRILRERTVALGLKNESRFGPEPASQPAPQKPPAPKPAPTAKVEQGGGQGSGHETAVPSRIASERKELPTAPTESAPAPSGTAASSEPRPATLPTARNAVMASTPDRFLRAARQRILSQADNRLRFLLDGRNWRKTARTTKSGSQQTGRYEGNEDGVVVQVGHRGAKASNVGEQFMLEDADLNQVGGNTIESKRAFSFKIAVVIDDIPVDIASAMQWERLGLLPPGTVGAAPILNPPMPPSLP